MFSSSFIRWILEKLISWSSNHDRFSTYTNESQFCSKEDKDIVFCSKEESSTYEENWPRKVDESCHHVAQDIHDDYENKTPKSCGCKYETVVDYHFNASQKLHKRAHKGHVSPKRPRNKSSSSFKTFSDRLLSPTITSLARSVGGVEKEKPRSHTPHPMSERAVIIQLHSVPLHSV